VFHVLATSVEPMFVHRSPKFAVRYRLRVLKYTMRGLAGSITNGGMNIAGSLTLIPMFLTLKLVPGGSRRRGPGPLVPHCVSANATPPVSWSIAVKPPSPPSTEGQFERAVEFACNVPLSCVPPRITVALVGLTETPA